jgi:hypothetical protein
LIENLLAAQPWSAMGEAKDDITKFVKLSGGLPRRPGKPHKDVSCRTAENIWPPSKMESQHDGTDGAFDNVAVERDAVVMALVALQIAFTVCV